MQIISFIVTTWSLSSKLVCLIFLYLFGSHPRSMVYTLCLLQIDSNQNEMNFSVFSKPVTE